MRLAAEQEHQSDIATAVIRQQTQQCTKQDGSYVEVPNYGTGYHYSSYLHSFISVIVLLAQARPTIMSCRCP